MKKIVIAAIILLVLGIALLIASVANLSRFSAYLIGRAIREYRYSRRHGTVVQGRYAFCEIIRCPFYRQD